MGWQESLLTYVWVFGVGRGNAAFVRSALNQGFIADMGAGVDFSPAEFIEKTFATDLDPYEKPSSETDKNARPAKIAQAILSHPHTDHITECEHLGNGEELYPSLLTCPHDKDGAEQN